MKCKILFLKVNISLQVEVLGVCINKCRSATVRTERSREPRQEGERGSVKRGSDSDRSAQSFKQACLHFGVLRGKICEKKQRTFVSFGSGETLMRTESTSF